MPREKKRGGREVTRTGHRVPPTEFTRAHRRAYRGYSGKKGGIMTKTGEHEGAQALIVQGADLPCRAWAENQNRRMPAGSHFAGCRPKRGQLQLHIASSRTNRRASSCARRATIIAGRRNSIGPAPRAAGIRTWSPGPHRPAPRDRTLLRRRSSRLSRSCRR